jgi:hypothetical protein
VQRPHLGVTSRWAAGPDGDGHVVVDSIAPIARADITYDLGP